MVVDCSFGLGYLPIIWGGFTLIALATSYGVAVLQGHVYPVLPSISDTGTRIPESNVFSLLMNISIILALANYFVRFFQCQHQARNCGDNREHLFRYNTFSFIFALTSIMGALIVANVQSRKEFYLLEIHDSGAITMFTFATFYFWIQTYISYKICLYGIYSAFLCHLRLMLTFTLTLCAGLYFASSAVSFHMYNSGNHLHNNVALWGPEDPGYTLHVIGNASEWLSFFVVMVYALTYFDEFQQVMLIIDCQEKSPTIISYDGIGEYASLKMSSMDSINDDNNN